MARSPVLLSFAGMHLCVLVEDADEGLHRRVQEGGSSVPVEWGAMPSPAGTISISHGSVLFSSRLPSRECGGHRIQIPDLVFLAASPRSPHEHKLRCDQRGSLGNQEGL